MRCRKLEAVEDEGLADHRNWVNDLLKGVGSDIVLSRTPADVPTLQSLLDGGPYTEDAANELVVLGTVFGDVLANELGLTWVVVDDENGQAFALKHLAKRVFVFPQDLLIKRIERGEDVNLTALLSEVTEAVRKEIANSAVGDDFSSGAA